MNRLAAILLCALSIVTPRWVLGGADPSTQPKQGAALLKTDILAVFAHPDDETGMAASLGRYARGEGKTVVHVYCTRGEGGGNMVGTHWGPSLGVLREVELRECLATLGVRACYFLDRLDWAYTESAAATLQRWGKEETLERLVRLVRVLRPEIVLTMNPAPRPGQHGHHQAAGILATEAFAAAADPQRFALQISKEGLSSWQPRRLFYGGSGEVTATIAVNEPLPDGRTPAQIASQALVHHRSQGFGNLADSPWLRRPQQFTLVKAFAPSAGIETDLFAGLPVPDPSPEPFPLASPRARPEIEVEFEPRPAWANYHRWTKEQGVEYVAVRAAADLPLVRGEPNKVRLHIHNTGPQAHEGILTLRAPPDWKVEPAERRVRVQAHSLSTLDCQVTPPEGAEADADFAAAFTSAGRSFEAMAKLHPLPRARVPRLENPPALDGTDQGWAGVPFIAIETSRTFQGQVADAADSSARFRLAHDGRTLFVDVRVFDDVVVSNIAPNDIKGHWRSDSVEICLDPDAGSEHTLSTFKLGVFPFDATGVVRAARDADANQGPVEETAPGTRLISRRTTDGYHIQAAIPWSEAGRPADRKRLGFNLIVYDGDKAAAAPGENINESRIAWAPRSGVPGRPEDWGRIDLE